LVALAVTGAAYAAGAVLDRLPSPIRAVIAASTLACGSLLDHAARVRDALETGDLGAARRELARFVGRDTRELGEAEIAGAAIESLAESTCDGIVAPLCYLAAFGLRGAFAYKAINTLDSLIGHIEAPYTHFGRVAARLDDAANLLPARLAVMYIAVAAALCGEDGRGALGLALRDGGKHRSPNAGQVEAAMAGALGVRLGGRRTYDGVVYEAPVIGASLAAPRAEDVRRAMRLVFVANLCAIAGASLLEGARW
jgi:adenosylcobinamide-phosphate synthase